MANVRAAWICDESPLTAKNRHPRPPIGQTPTMHRRTMVRCLVPLVTVATAAASFTAAAATVPTPTPTPTPTPPVVSEDPGPEPTTAPPATDAPATEPPDTTPPPVTEPPATTAAPTEPAPEPVAPETTEAIEPAGPSLRILLTNDDGWNAEGITAVRDALIAAGHDVVVVAPATNQSGTGARVTFVGDLTLTQHSAGVFSVDGSPADATELGLDIAFGGELPDLVVSGSNAGQNIGAVAVHSGTLGAAVTALNEGVPAIAVSTEEDLATGEGDFDGTASFLATVVDTLAVAADDGPILPDGIGLNINFPLVETGGDPAGVAITTTDTGFLDVEYGEVSVPDVGEDSPINPGLGIADPVDPDADVAMLADDFVTVTFIAGNYDVTPPEQAAAIDELGPLLVDLGL